MTTSPEPAQAREFNLEAILLSTPFIIFLALLCVIGCAPYIPLFDLDEGAFSEATREMLTSGNWVSTYLNGEPRHDKPILIYWFQAVSVKLFGLHPLAFRLPSLLASLTWIFIIYRFCKEFIDERTARITVWVFCCCILTTTMFKAATADALLNCLITIICFDIYRYSQTPNSKRLVLLGIYLGLGFLTKGPVAIIIPLGASLAALSICGQFNRWFQAVIHPYSWLTFLIIVTPWHIAVYLDQGWAFFEGFYLGHNVNRFSSTMEQHGGSPFYYLLLLPIALAPFTKFWLDSFKSVKIIGKDLLTTYFWFWFLIPFTIFSFSKTQLPHYILYGMAPVFILLAQQLKLVQERSSTSSMIALAVGVIIAFTLLAFPFLIDSSLSSIKSPYDHAVASLANDMFKSSYRPFSIALLVAAALVIFSPRLSRLSRFLCLSFILALNANFILGPLVAFAQQQPIVNAAKISRTYPGRVIAYKIKMPSFSVYNQKIVAEHTPQEGDLIFTKISHLEKLNKIDPTKNTKTVFNNGGIVLIEYGTSADD